MAEQSGANVSGWVVGLLLFQVPWSAMAIFAWNLPFFFSSMLYDSAWYGMLFILLSFCAMLPTLVALGIIMANKPNASQKYAEQLWAGLFCLPIGLEWAYLWMVALPFTWTLLPWGDFAYNWWKIFPYFGLICMSSGALAPLIMIFGPDPEPMHELGTRYLQKGMKGSDVREVQQLLNKHGISCGVDGNFGPQTEEAVKQFQSRGGFGLKVDGVVGKKTRVALQEEPEKPEGSQISVNPSHPTPHEPITVNFSGSTGDKHAWIGIFSEGAANTEHHGRWLYVCGTQAPELAITDGSVTFPAGLEAGNHEVRLFGDNGHEQLLDSHSFSVSDQVAESKPEVQMKDAIIHDNHLHGTVTGHPKLGTTEVKTSRIINQDKEGEIHRIETENTIYLIRENDWSDNVSEEEEAPAGEVVPVEEAPVMEAPVEVKAKQQAAERIQTRARDLKGMTQELQNVTFSSDREKIIKGATDQPQSVDLVIEKVDRTAAGFRLRDELKGGMTVFGRTAEGAEIEMRMPSSMNDEIKRLGKSDTLTCKASVAGWNTIRKLLQMDWME